MEVSRMVLQSPNTYDAHFTIIFSSEGVQIGGIASAFGVIGTWTGIRHDRGKYLLVSF
jgi:hypothetical protein